MIASKYGESQAASWSTRNHLYEMATVKVSSVHRAQANEPSARGAHDRHPTDALRACRSCRSASRRRHQRSAHLAAGLARMHIGEWARIGILDMRLEHGRQQFHVGAVVPCAFAARATARA